METVRSTEPDRVFRFGPFELSERAGELRKNGVRIKLQEQPFRVLVELVANAGKVLSREELQQRLWPADTFVDFDVGLNTAIRKLRQALNDDAEEPRYIETLARRGYRFIAPVSLISSAPTTAIEAQPEPATEPPSVLNDVPPQASQPSSIVPQLSPVAITEKAAPSRSPWIAAAVAAVAVASALIVWWRIPRAMPVVESMTQLTDDGQPKNPRLLTDGSRIYFNEGAFLSLRIAQVGIRGGVPAEIQTTLPAPRIVSLAPKGAALMISSGGWEIMMEPLWELPLPAGAPHPIGNLDARDGTYTADGHILLSQQNSLVETDADASDRRTLISDLDGEIFNPSMSPDGTRIAFIFGGSQPSRYGAGLTLPGIFEANSDGSGLRAIVDSKGDGRIASIAWTPDSKYLVFSEAHGRASDLWIVPSEERRSSRSRQPVRLTNGPLAYAGAAITPDGKQILTVGSSDRAELVRYDLATGLNWFVTTSRPGSLFRFCRACQHSIPPSPVMDNGLPTRPILISHFGAAAAMERSACNSLILRCKRSTPLSRLTVSKLPTKP